MRSSVTPTVPTGTLTHPDRLHPHLVGAAPSIAI
jgi:hypothetical protein